MADKNKAVASETPAQSDESARESISLQATVVSMFTKVIDKDTRVTYASLKNETGKFYAAWKNSYFARDIVVHRKYNFTGRFKRTPTMTILADPLFTDVPIINKYFDFSLLAPGERKPGRSATTKFAVALLVLTIAGAGLTVAFNSNYVERKLAERRQLVSAAVE